MSTLRVNSLLNAAGTDTPAIDGLAKAWVNFNGTGTVAIRGAFNVSSITDIGTGNYTVNFTTAMADANYVVNTNVVTDGNIAVSQVFELNTTSARILTGDAYRIGSYASNVLDLTSVYVTVFR